MTPWLMVSCVVPNADGIGIEKRAWAHLTALAAVGRPHLWLALTPAQLASPPDLSGLQSLCAEILVLPLVETARGRKYENSAVLLLRRLIHWGASSWTFGPEAISRLAKLPRELRQANVFCFRLICFGHWQRLRQHCQVKPTRLIVDFDDVESVAQRRLLRVQGHTLGRAHRIAARLTIGEIWWQERKALREAEVLVCSVPDQRQLLQRQAQANVAVIPNSFPVSPALAPRARTSALQVLFLGTLSYAPNADAAQYAVQEILPALERLGATNVCLRIVGRRPPPDIRALHRHPAVEVLGDVDSVVDAYRDADLVIVPIRFGGGTRIKILEALTLSRPVVSTTLGCEGLELLDEHDLLIADSPEAFAQQCLRLQQDPALAERLAHQGRETVLRLYSDGVVREALVSLFNGKQAAPIQPETAAADGENSAP